MLLHACSVLDTHASSSSSEGPGSRSSHKSLDEQQLSRLSAECPRLTSLAGRANVCADTVAMATVLADGWEAAETGWRASAGLSGSAAAAAAAAREQLGRRRRSHRFKGAALKRLEKN